MSSQAFFWINAGLGAAFILLFVIRRGQRQPTKLNMRRSGVAMVPSGSASKGRVVETMSAETIAAQRLSGKEQTINILFNYNGHSWDAFEVLGLPAGAPKGMVDEAYKREVARASESGRDFIDSAYHAIRIHRSA